MAATDELVVEHHGSTAWVTLNRPDARNALSRDLNLRMQELTATLEDRADIRAIVLTGTGDKVFCAGADLKERRGVSAAETGPYINAIAGAIGSWAESRKPTICALNGSAYGGGLELALACDLRLAADGIEMGLLEVRLGIIPGAGGTQRLARVAGAAAAKELIFTGRRVPAALAAELGIVTRVVAPAELVTAAERLAAEVAECAPLAVAAAKRAIDEGAALPLDDALALERARYETNLGSEDRNEGLAAFGEKRRPQFKGK